MKKFKNMNIISFNTGLVLILLIIVCFLYELLFKKNLEGFYTEAFDPKIGFVKITGADGKQRIDEGLVNRRQQERQLAEGTWQDPYAPIYRETTP